MASVVLAAAWLSPAPVAAQTRLAPLFQDHMVLQRDQPIVVWGEAAPNEALTVRVAARVTETRADGEGRFRCTLEPLPAGGPHTLEVQSAGGATTTLSDVLVGEVWLCSGQSNMAWSMRRFQDCQDDLAAADLPRLRVFQVAQATSIEPAATCEGTWASSSPDAVREFSAVAFFFGRMLHDELDVPVGLVQSAWGGTRAEAWTRRAALQNDPASRPILARWDAIRAAWPDAKQKYDVALASWKKQSDRAKEAGEKPPRRPGMPRGPLDRHSPSALYSGMIAPLVPFTFRGVIWYQGESNAGRAEQYRTLFPTMIRDWRDAFGRPELPFLFVQLANFDHSGPGAAWAELRDAQREALALPATGMAVTIDIGNPKDIHPDKKDEVGRRLALWALRDVYGRDSVVCSGPLYRSAEVEGAAIRVSFDHVGEGLRGRGADGADGGTLRGFEIAGADRNFAPARARIAGATVLVSSPEIAEPVAVRYAWDDDPQVSLFNAEGLPASPFRTDDWPGVTAGNYDPR